MQTIKTAKLIERLCLPFAFGALLGICAQAQTTTPGAIQPPIEQIVTQPETQASPLAGRSDARMSESKLQPTMSSDGDVAPVIQPPDWMNLVFALIKTVGGVGLVLSLFLAAFLAFKKFAPQYFAKQPGAKNMRLIEALPMGEKRSIALVRVGEKSLLVGNTPNQISLLASLSGPEILSSKENESPQGVETVVRRQVAGKNSFLKLYKMERGTPVQKREAQSMIPPDIRGKMRELRRTLES